LTDVESNQLDRTSPIPLYYQLQRILRQGIEAGQWNPGDRLFSEAEMEAVFGVSRTVTRNALDVLAADGLVYRVKGKGTIVAEPKASYFGATASRSSLWRYDPATLIVSSVIESRRTVAGEVVGRALGTGPMEPVLEMTYVLDVDGTPAAIVHFFFSSSALSGLSAVGLPSIRVGGPDVVMQLADDHQYQPRTSSLIIEASSVTRYDSGVLDVFEGSPIFVLTTTDRNKADVPIGFGRSLVRGDLFCLAAMDLENRASHLGAVHLRAQDCPPERLSGPSGG